MPGFDGTGPDGLGPVTGRGMGNCPKRQTRGCGRGLGSGMGSGLRQGLGRGQGDFCLAENVTIQERIELLKENAKRLAIEIENLEKEQK